MSNKKALIICSGGMDSVTLLHDIVNKKGPKNVGAITFLYGSRHSKQEVICAKHNCRKLKVKHKIVDMQEVFKNYKSALLGSEKIPQGHYEDENMKKTVVPFRNGILLSVAAGFAEQWDVGTIYYGAHAGDHAIYPDCRKDFIEAMSKAVTKGTYNKIKIKAPYYKINKIGIIKIGIKLKVDYKKTWTCYDPQGKEACGKCGSCVERLEAFKFNNLKDPLNYKKYV